MTLFYDNYKDNRFFFRFKLSLLSDIQIIICEIRNIPICATTDESIFIFSYIDILEDSYLLSENQKYIYLLFIRRVYFMTNFKEDTYYFVST